MTSQEQEKIVIDSSDASAVDKHIQQVLKELQKKKVEPMLIKFKEWYETKEIEIGGVPLYIFSFSRIILNRKKNKKQVKVFNDELIPIFKSFLYLYGPKYHEELMTIIKSMVEPNIKVDGNLVMAGRYSDREIKLINDMFRLVKTHQGSISVLKPIKHTRSKSKKSITSEPYERAFKDSTSNTDVTPDDQPAFISDNERKRYLNGTLNLKLRHARSLDKLDPRHSVGANSTTTDVTEDNLLDKLIISISKLQVKK